MNNIERKKILYISDHVCFPSGVGTQGKMLIEGLLKTEKYKFLCLGGAIQHADYRVARIEPEKWGDNWFVKPVNGFGDRNLIRQLLLSERPDALVLFQDPRFFTWLWEMEDEIRSVCPIIYNHIWDNDPANFSFNQVIFDSVDYLAAISLKTFGLLDLSKTPKDKFSYIPHFIDREVFKPLEEDENKVFKNQALGDLRDKKFLTFWNNRNARRKNTGDVVETFKLFMDKIGKENAGFIFHTAPRDPEGQDLFALIKQYDLEKNVIIIENPIEAFELNKIYNVVDCTINIAFAEGHGCSSGESLMAGTPVVSNMTGGLQFQIGDWWEGLPHFKDQKLMTETAKKLWNNKKSNWWGVPCFPATRSCVGNQQLPFIYEDRCTQEDAANGMLKLYEMGRTKRRELGLRARKWFDEKFNQEKTISSWDKILTDTIENYKVNGIKAHRKTEI